NAVRCYGRIKAAESKVKTAIAPSGTFFTPYFFIPLSNSHLSAQERRIHTDSIIIADRIPGADVRPEPQYNVNNDGVIDAGAEVSAYFYRRTLDVGARLTLNRTVAWQALAGLRGELRGGWNWDVSFQHGRTQLRHAYTNDVNYDRMQASILGCPP